MYTNIPTLTALQIIGDYLQIHGKDFSYPTNTLIAALELVMQNSIFQFGNLFYKHLTGTAMGTPPAPPWATIFYGIHEIVILDKFKDCCIFLYKRFIDVIIGIWLCHPDPEEDFCLWTSFQAWLNDFHRMEWLTSKRNHTVDFMDLTISIANGKIETTLFEKELNLYLYIPPPTVHTHQVYSPVLLLDRSCDFINFALTKTISSKE